MQGFGDSGLRVQGFGTLESRIASGSAPSSRSWIKAIFLEVYPRVTNLEAS